MWHTNARTRRQLVPLGQTVIEDDFWGPKLRLLREVTVNDVFTKFEQCGAFANFDRVARGEQGGFQGHPWFDGLIWETMTAAADFLATDYDAGLDARLDGYIARIAAAQAVDAQGYINTYVSLMRTRPEGSQRWGANGGNQLYNHEMYNAGCLIEAGVHHYRATGKTNLLTLAVRFANYLCSYIGPSPKRNLVPAHSLPEEALIKLYQLLRDPESSLAAQLIPGVDPVQYLDLARFWIDNRGNHEGRVSFTEYAQDHCCTVHQPEAVGHAVRAMLLYTGLTALGLEVEGGGYLEAAQRLWRDVTERKMYVTGGLGPIHEYEGFAYGYYLPNAGYLETCAGVGLAFWAGLMGQAFDGAEYADVAERVLYNNILPGVSLQGNRYTYQNPLEAKGNLHRWDWHGCPCCPPMLLKAAAGLAGQIYGHDGHDIYVQHYIGSRSVIPVAAGEVEISQSSGYVWEGRVTLTVRPRGSGAFTLRLRKPGWAQALRVTVNGQAVDPVPMQSGYAVIRREWRDGDTIEAEMGIGVQRIVAHPYVNHLQGKAALQRGPLIYCLEGIDNPGGRDKISRVLPADAQLEAHYDPALLGGVAVIRGADCEGRAMTAVPYYAWDNRTASSPEDDWMQVWVGQEGLEKPTLPEAGDVTGWEHTLYRPLPL